MVQQRGLQQGGAAGSSDQLDMPPLVHAHGPRAPSARVHLPSLRASIGAPPSHAPGQPASHTQQPASNHMRPQQVSSGYGQRPGSAMRQPGQMQARPPSAMHGQQPRPGLQGSGGHAPGGPPRPVHRHLSLQHRGALGGAPDTHTRPQPQPVHAPAVPVQSSPAARTLLRRASMTGPSVPWSTGALLPLAMVAAGGGGQQAGAAASGGDPWGSGPVQPAAAADDRGSGGRQTGGALVVNTQPQQVAAASSNGYATGIAAQGRSSGTVAAPALSVRAGSQAGMVTGVAGGGAENVAGPSWSLEPPTIQAATRLSGLWPLALQADVSPAEGAAAGVTLASPGAPRSPLLPGAIASAALSPTTPTPAAATATGTAAVGTGAADYARSSQTGERLSWQRYSGGITTRRPLLAPRTQPALQQPQTTPTIPTTLAAASAVAHAAAAGPRVAPPHSSLHTPTRTAAVRTSQPQLQPQPQPAGNPAPSANLIGLSTPEQGAPPGLLTRTSSQAPVRRIIPYALAVPADPLAGSARLQPQVVANLSPPTLASTQDSRAPAVVPAPGSAAAAGLELRSPGRMLPPVQLTFPSRTGSRQQPRFAVGLEGLQGLMDMSQQRNAAEETAGTWAHMGAHSSSALSPHMMLHGPSGLVMDPQHTMGWPQHMYSGHPGHQVSPAPWHTGAAQQQQQQQQQQHWPGQHWPDGGPSQWGTNPTSGVPQHAAHAPPMHHVQHQTQQQQQPQQQQHHPSLYMHEPSSDSVSSSHSPDTTTSHPGHTSSSRAPHQAPQQLRLLPVGWRLGQTGRSTRSEYSSGGEEEEGRGRVGGAGGVGSGDGSEEEEEDDYDYGMATDSGADDEEEEHEDDGVGAAGQRADLGLQYDSVYNPLMHPASWPIPDSAVPHLMMGPNHNHQHHQGHHQGHQGGGAGVYVPQPGDHLMSHPHFSEAGHMAVAHHYSQAGHMSEAGYAHHPLYTDTTVHGGPSGSSSRDGAGVGAGGAAGGAGGGGARGRSAQLRGPPSSCGSSGCGSSSHAGMEEEDGGPPGAVRMDTQGYGGYGSYPSYLGSHYSAAAAGGEERTSQPTSHQFRPLLPRLMPSEDWRGAQGGMGPGPHQRHAPLLPPPTAPAAVSAPGTFGLMDRDHPHDDSSVSGMGGTDMGPGTAGMRLPFQQWMSQHAARLLLPHHMRNMADLFTADMLWSTRQGGGQGPEGAQQPSSNAAAGGHTTDTRGVPVPMPVGRHTGVLFGKPSSGRSSQRLLALSAGGAGSKEGPGVDMFCGRYPSKAVRQLAGDSQFMAELLTELPGVDPTCSVVMDMVMGLAGHRGEAPGQAQP